MEPEITNTGELADKNIIYYKYNHYPNCKLGKVYHQIKNYEAWKEAEEYQEK